MNSAFLALAAAGVASVGGFGISTQTSPVQTAQVLNSVPDYGQEGGVFSEWLNADAPQCVAVSKIGSVSHLTNLRLSNSNSCERSTLPFHRFRDSSHLGTAQSWQAPTAGR
jgi:hypothetical protein